MVCCNGAIWTARVSCRPLNHDAVRYLCFILDADTCSCEEKMATRLTVNLVPMFKEACRSLRRLFTRTYNAAIWAIQRVRSDMHVDIES